MNRIIFVAYMAAMGSTMLFGEPLPDCAPASNVYAKVYKTYDDYILSGRPRSREYLFDSVRGGGVQMDLEGMQLERFFDLSSYVSNHCAEIAADWRTYETNEMVRFTTLSAVGYSGFCNYTNFVDIVATRRLSDPSLCSWDTVQFLISPYGTPGEAYLGLNCDLPVVSNIVLKIRQIAVMENNTNAVNGCDSFLSGEWKRHHLEMKAAGAL